MTVMQSGLLSPGHKVHPRDKTLIDIVFVIVMTRKRTTGMVRNLQEAVGYLRPENMLVEYHGTAGYGVAAGGGKLFQYPRFDPGRYSEHRTAA